VRDEHRRDRAVVLEQVPLRDPLVGEQDAFRAREADRSRRHAAGCTCPVVCMSTRAGRRLTCVAYVALAATYYDDLAYLSDVPVLYLALAVIGVPLAAAAAGWLVAGREPPAIARPVIE
jgi:hypothetical protein